MSKLFTIFLVGLVLLGVLSSCKSTRVAERSKNIPNRKGEEIIDSVKQHALRLEWISIKMDVEFKTPKISDSFKMYVRMKSDSAIWVSATYYAVEIARFLFTPDSVKYMDRKNNQYYVGGYEYLQHLFQVEANFDMLQSLILANAPSMDGAEEKVRSARDNGYYFLSFLRKGQLRRAQRKDELRKDLDLVISLWINPETYRIDHMSLEDFEDDRTLSAFYSDFQAAANSSYPHKHRFLLDTGNEQVDVNTSVMKVSINNPVSLSFSIPSKYEKLVP